ncbi:hypothetical protein ABZ815_02075 [Nonomuraea sp. NPDC047529]|uniref:hypothetical protein n=1 Tax=Nonomuraea sp. NPDC047529 TaxID=3155623 RepID=UPI003410B326
MATRKSPWVWISVVAAGLVAGALGTIFTVLGLEEADRLASVVGVFATLGGLVVSVYGVVLARRQGNPQRNPPSSAAPSPKPPEGPFTAQGERSVAVRDNSGVIQTGDGSTAQR